jgi:hypothetical protein
MSSIVIMLGAANAASGRIGRMSIRRGTLVAGSGSLRPMRLEIRPAPMANQQTGRIKQPEHLRDDLNRFAFLLGGTDGQHLLEPGHHYQGEPSSLAAIDGAVRACAWECATRSRSSSRTATHRTAFVISTRPWGVDDVAEEGFLASSDTFSEAMPRS